MAGPPIPMTAKIAQADLDAVKKELDQWQGAPLELRTKKAIEGGASLFVPALRSAAPVSPRGKTGKYPHPPGTLKRSIGVRKLRKRPGEIASVYVGPRVYYGQWVQHGTRMGQRPNPFVGRVQLQLESGVLSFIDEQITRLA